MKYLLSGKQKNSNVIPCRHPGKTIKAESYFCPVFSD